MRKAWRRIPIILALVIMSGCVTTGVTPTAQIKAATNQGTGVTDQQSRTLTPYYGPKKRLAVTEFETKAKGASREIGSGITEMIITALQETGRFIIVERTAVSDILKEQAFGVSGAVKGGSEAKIGELLGAQVLVKGVITEFEESKGGGALGGAFKGIGVGIGKVSGYVAIDLRIFDATSGVILESHRSEGKVAKTGLAGGLSIKGMKIGGAGFKKTCIGEAVRKAIDDAVVFVVSKMDAMPWQGRVVLTKTGKIYINAGRNTGIKAGDTFDVYNKGEELIDPETGISLGWEQEKIGQVQVSNVQEKFAIAKVTAGSGGEKGDIVKLSTREAITPTKAAPPTQIPAAKIMVVIPEEHIGRKVPDPAGETEIIKKLIEKGFEVVDQGQVKRIRQSQRVASALKDNKAARDLGKEFEADIIIIGEAFSEFAKRMEAGMVSCRARVEARAVRTDTGRILAADGRHGSALDISENIAGKRALQDAGSELADYFIQQIIKNWSTP